MSFYVRKLGRNLVIQWLRIIHSNILLIPFQDFTLSSYFDLLLPN